MKRKSNLQSRNMSVPTWLGVFVIVVLILIMGGAVWMRMGQSTSELSVVPSPQPIRVSEGVSPSNFSTGYNVCAKLPPPVGRACLGEACGGSAADGSTTHGFYCVDTCGDGKRYPGGVCQNATCTSECQKHGDPIPANPMEKF